MAIHDNNRLEKRDKSRGKGKETAPWERDAKGDGAVTWSDVDSDLLRATTAAVCAAGASIQLTRTRDGGSLGVRIYDDALEVKTVWERPGEGLEALLETIRQYYAQNGF